MHLGILEYIQQILQSFSRSDYSIVEEHNLQRLYHVAVNLFEHEFYL